MDKFQSFGEVLSMLRRRFFLWASIIVIGGLISLAYVLGLPRDYETYATIQIEQPSIKTGATSPGALNADILQKLQIVEQRVMARDNLLTIIDKFGLYNDAPLSELQKVELLRKAAGVIHITNPDFRWRQDISPSALLVSVRMTDPVLAANVANELVNNVLEQEEKRRTEQVSETLSFFDGEERRIGAAITNLEQQIADYKQENAVLLPGGVEALRTRLVDLQQIELEVQRQLLENVGISSGGNSVRAQRLRRLQEESELYQIEIAEIEAALKDTPRIEQQYNRLERQLTKLEEQYQAITAGKAEAEMQQMLEASQQTDSFTVLEKALPPDWPIAPSRKRILAMGGVLSVMVALSLVFVLEMRSPVIWTRGQLERQLRLRAVAAIPVLETPRQRRRRKLTRLTKVFGLLAVSGGLAAMILKLGK
ncbi:MAG: Wzz/FepE/Etk N-terminal domain-containing protein [Shimia sp.]|uniref:GumC family protein n=1 Tax=Shimia sp. TaxID=1954381 RepID=UPI0025F7BD70|nr:Wzz/FepE/Etk N-terminal domain-containing protein [Shimia sp.]MCH2067269.1 Wzz/FepE/Etk N-terminal domain-containing protein [Shimia sp.]